jgi:hypothetical protein
MTRPTIFIFLVAWQAFSLPLLAQEPTEQTIVEHDQRIADLESSLAQLRRSIYQKPTNDDYRSSWSAGYSFLFAKLHYKESFQAMVSDLGTGTQNLIPFDNDYELTPRVWVGFQTKNGIGVRGSYWNFDHASRPFNATSNGVQIPSATSTSVIFPALIVAPFPGDILSVNQFLDASTVDLEATYDFRIKRLEATLGAGLRYAHWDQRFDGRVTPGPVPIASPASLTWQREFEGLGPALSAQGKMPIGCNGFYGTGGVNVSFLFGEKNLSRIVSNDATPAPNTGLPILVLAGSDEITGIYGVSVGAGRQRQTRFGKMFVEGAYESQLWTEGGAPTITFAGFNGFSVSLGITR